MPGKVPALENTLKSWFPAIRPKTLPATACPVLTGSAPAFQAGGFQAVTDQEPAEPSGPPIRSTLLQ